MVTMAGNEHCCHPEDSMIYNIHIFFSNAYIRALNYYYSHHPTATAVDVYRLTPCIVKNKFISFYFIEKKKKIIIFYHHCNARAT